MIRSSTDNGENIQAHEQHITINSSLLRRANICTTPNSSPSPEARSFSIESDSSSDGSSSSPLLKLSPNAPRNKRSFAEDHDNYCPTRPKGFKRRNGLQRKFPLRHVRFFRLVWCIAVILGEQASFWGMVYRCSWPENASWVNFQCVACICQMRTKENMTNPMQELIFTALCRIRANQPSRNATGLPLSLIRN